MTSMRVRKTLARELGRYWQETLCLYPSAHFLPRTNNNPQILLTSFIIFVPLHIKRFKTDFGAMFTEHISAELILFFILYGITGVVPFMAAIYLLLRRGNAFAPEVTPPVRLRRWAASFFCHVSAGSCVVDAFLLLFPPFPFYGRLDSFCRLCGDCRVR